MGTSRNNEGNNKIEISKAAYDEINERGTWGLEELTDMKMKDPTEAVTTYITFNTLTVKDGFNGFSLEELRNIDYRNHVEKKIDLGEIYIKNQK